MVSLRNPLGRSDFGHLMMVYIPVVTFLVFFWIRMVEKLIQVPFWIKGRFLGFFQAVLLFWLIVLFFKFFLVQLKFKESRLLRWQGVKRWNLVFNQETGVYLEREESQSLAEAVRFLQRQTKKDEPIYAHSSSGGFYHLTGRPNVVYYDAGWYLRSEEEQKEAIKQLETNRVRWAVRLADDEFRRGSLLEDYLGEYFEEKKVFGRCVILQRKKAKAGESWFWEREARLIMDDWQTVKPEERLSFVGQTDEPVMVSMSEVELSLSYWLMTKSLAKTRLRMILNDELEVFSETPFVPLAVMKGQEAMRFRFGQPIKVKKVALILDAPGGFNSLPRRVEIKRASFY